MEGRRDDRRIRKTKALLRGALTSLLERKDVKDITVSELAALADVNRGTFYCHYKDIYDMVEQLESELFQEFAAVLNAYSENSLRHGLRPILRDVFEFIERNLDLCSGLLNLERDTSFLERLKETVQAKVAREWCGLYPSLNGPRGQYYLPFVVGGVIGLIQQWLVQTPRESAEEMAALAEQLILEGIGKLGE